MQRYIKVCLVNMLQVFGTSTTINKEHLRLRLYTQ